MLKGSIDPLIGYQRGVPVAQRRGKLDSFQCCLIPVGTFVGRPILSHHIFLSVAIKYMFSLDVLLFYFSALRCSSGFDRHRQDWVDNSCPDEVSHQDKVKRLYYISSRLHLFLFHMQNVQTKDKMCDHIDTTYLYPFTTTVAAKTTARSKEVTAGGDTPSTSQPPTSVPTEGGVQQLYRRLSPVLCFPL